MISVSWIVAVAGFLSQRILLGENRFIGVVDKLTYMTNTAAQLDSSPFA